MKTGNLLRLFPALALLAATEPGLPAQTGSAAKRCSSAASSAAGTLRVMPLGDSIVYGQSNTTGAWRSHLWDLASAAGYSFEYVGSLTHGSLPDPPSAHNEGHDEYDYVDLTPWVGQWLAAADPDIILIADAPDVSVGTTAVLQELADLLDKITAAKPNAYVLVSDLIRTNNSSLEPVVIEINRNMPSVLTPRIAAGKRIVPVTGMNEALTASDLADAFHPTQSGYDKMAEVWWPVLQRVLEQAGAAGMSGNKRGRPPLFSDRGQSRLSPIRARAAAR